MASRASPTSGYDARPPRHPERPRLAHIPGLLLVAIGLAFLLGAIFPEGARGGLFLVALGVAFGIARLLRGRPGYAVPAGILSALGIYGVLQQLHFFQTVVPSSAQNAGWFFVLLGAGFGLVYLLYPRPRAAWPLFPGMALVGVGCLLLSSIALGPLAPLAGIGSFWPVVLVLVGGWLLVRHRLPPPVAGVTAVVGFALIVLYAIVAVAASVAAQRSSLPLGAFATPYADTLSLAAPLGSGTSSLDIANPNGAIVVRGGPGPGIAVTAHRYYWDQSHPPNVALTPSGSRVTLSTDLPPGGGSHVDYTVDVPSGVTVTVHGGSGAVSVQNASGDLDVQTTSGPINLSGVVRGATSVETHSGAIAVQLQPGTSARVDASSRSGAVSGSGPGLTVQSAGPHLLHAEVAAGEGTLTARATSGSISIQSVASASPQ